MDSSSQRESDTCDGGSILGLPMFLLVQILLGAVIRRDFMKSALQLSTVCKAFQEAVQAFTEAIIGGRTVTTIIEKVHGEEAQMLEIGKLVRITPKVESLTVFNRDDCSDCNEPRFHVVPSMISSWSTVIGTTLRDLSIQTHEGLNWKHFQALANLPLLESLMATVELDSDIAGCRVFESVKTLHVDVKKQRGDGVFACFLCLFPNLTFLRLIDDNEMVPGWSTYVVEHAILEELVVFGSLYHLGITCPRLRILNLRGSVGELVLGNNGRLDEIRLLAEIRDLKFEMDTFNLHNSIFEFALFDENLISRFLLRSMKTLEKVHVIMLECLPWANICKALKNTLSFPRLVELTLSIVAESIDIQMSREWLKVSPELQHISFELREELFEETQGVYGDDALVKKIEELQKLFPRVRFTFIRQVISGH